MFCPALDLCVLPCCAEEEKKGKKKAQFSEGASVAEFFYPLEVALRGLLAKHLCLEKVDVMPRSHHASSLCGKPKMEGKGKRGIRKLLGREREARSKLFPKIPPPGAVSPTTMLHN